MCGGQVVTAAVLMELFDVPNTTQLAVHIAFKSAAGAVVR